MASSSRVIRVLMVEDHEVLRSSLSLLIETYDDIELVGEAENGDQALRLCGELRPDVMLLDLNIPLVDGLTVARIVREMYPLRGCLTQPKASLIQPPHLLAASLRWRNHVVSIWGYRAWETS